MDGGQERSHREGIPTSPQPGERYDLLLFVWCEHYKFYRRYGLWDVPTIWLNAALFFLVLFYV